MAADPAPYLLLAQSERRLRFLDELAQATRRLSDPGEVLQVTARLLGEHLGASRCAYAQVDADEDHFDLIGDHNRGVPSIVGRYAFSDFGAAVRALMVADRPYVNADVDTDPLTAGGPLDAYRLTRIRAVICVPLHKQGRFVAAMAVHQDVPRRWSDDEVALVRTVVDRCWESLERLRTQDALRRAHQRLSLALAAGELGDWHWNAATDTVTLSERACEILGVPAGTDGGWEPLRRLLHPDDRATARAAVQRALAERTTYDIEYRVMRDGGIAWVATQGKGEYAADGRVLGMTGILQDVTARHLAQEQARGETEMLELLNRTGAALAAELDLGMLLQSVTDSATQLTGARFGAFFYNGTDERGDAYLLYTLSGAPKEAFERFGHPRPTALFGPTFNGGAPIRLDDVTRDPRYGQWGPSHGMPKGHLPVRSYLAVPVISGTTVIGGLFFGHPEPGVFTERSERLAVGVASQAAIAVDNARLYAQARRAGEERTALLESERAARREAERASAVKDEFLATLSHELRTPLSAILGWVHILKRKLDPAQADLRKGVDVIDRSTRVQVQLIEDLLDMSRIISGKLRLDVKPVATASAVQAALDTVRPAADAAGVQLDARVDPSADNVVADPARLQQVVWNLLSNAVKFTPRGGRIDVQARGVGGDVEIVVADDGIGIRPEFLPYVFDRFRQADGSTTRRHGGLGLGLSIARHLVDLHDGTLEAFSAGEGQGATFRVRLPRHPAQAAAAPQEAAADAAGADAIDLSGLTVLVVDDETDARELLQRVLEDSGARVLLADGAEVALRQVRTLRPQVLVSDIGMPGIDGCELLRRVRRLGPDQGGLLPAVALTAFARSEDRVRALRAGFAAHVAKPMEPLELLATVAALVGRTDAGA